MACDVSPVAMFFFWSLPSYIRLQALLGTNTFDFTLGLNTIACVELCWGWKAPNIVLRTKRHNIWNTHPLLCPRYLLISTSPGHPIIKTNKTGYLMCFWDALGLADICQQDNHQHGQHFNMKPYDLQNLWLSWTYGRPDLMVVLILWLSWSYGCPHLMIVRILWLSTSYDCLDL